MPKLIHYQDTPIWDKQSIPDSLLRLHNTKKDTWAKLHILEGSLHFVFLDDAGQVTEEVSRQAGEEPILIAPNAKHRISSLSDDARCQLSFYYEAGAH